MKTSVFEHRSTMPTTLEQMWAFHDAPNAFTTLTPPPIFVQMHRNERTSLTSGEVEFTLWFGPLPVRWTARHEPGPTPTSFIDRQVKGPMDYWEHQHIMQEVPGGVELIDRITLGYPKAFPRSLFTHLLFGALPLRILFVYRHLRTRLAVTRGTTVSKQSA
jgi:ligand-binding SRPBCC domain-containing protein